MAVKNAIRRTDTVLQQRAGLLGHGESFRQTGNQAFAPCPNPFIL